MYMRWQGVNNQKMTQKTFPTITWVGAGTKGCILEVYLPLRSGLTNSLSNVLFVLSILAWVRPSVSLQLTVTITTTQLTQARKDRRCLTWHRRVSKVEHFVFPTFRRVEPPGVETKQSIRSFCVRYQPVDARKPGGKTVSTLAFAHKLDIAQALDIQ